MSLVLAVLLAALLAGRLAGGSLERLGSLQLRRRRAVVLALVAQVLGAVLGGPAHALGLAASAALVVSFLLANRGVRGTGLVALGLAANAAVVGLNGAMPVSSTAAARSGVGTAPFLDGSDPRHELADARTRLRWLGDVIPVPLPWRPEVVSPGDVLVAAGAGQLVVLAMLRPLRAVPAVPAPSPGAQAGPAAARRRTGALPPMPVREPRRRGREARPEAPTGGPARPEQDPTWSRRGGSAVRR